MGELAQGAGRPGVDLQVGRRGAGGEGEFVKPVEGAGAVEELEEEGGGGLAVDFGGGGHGWCRGA